MLYTGVIIILWSRYGPVQVVGGIATILRLLPHSLLSHQLKKKKKKRVWRLRMIWHNKRLVDIKLRTKCLPPYRMKCWLNALLRQLLSILQFAFQEYFTHASIVVPLNHHGVLWNMLDSIRWTFTIVVQWCSTIRRTWMRWYQYGRNMDLMNRTYGGDDCQLICVFHIPCSC